MLTESEKDWLKRRCMAPTPFCGWCMKYTFCCDPWYPCPIKKGSDWRDAAEFEARVAARLARISFERGGAYPCRNGMPTLGCMRDKTAFTGPFAVHCEDCLLRDVRLTVEGEMDA